MEKKSSLNGWLKRRFNQGQQSKLSDKEILQLEVCNRYYVITN